MKKVDIFRHYLRKVLLIVISLIILFPLLYMISSSFFVQKDFNNARFFPSTINWENYKKTLSHRYFFSYLTNSIATSVLTAFMRTGISILTAFAFAFLSFKGKRIIFVLLISTLFVPSEALLYQNYRTISSMGFLDTWIGIILPSLFSASQMLLLYGSFKAQGRECYDAARIDGAKDISFVIKILTPLSGAAVLTVFVQTLITSFNAYLWPLLVTNKPRSRTIQIGITMLGFSESGEMGAEMATLVLITLPFLILLAFTKKRIEKALIRK